MTTYTYTPHVQAEIERMIRDAIPLPRVTLRKADLQEDFGGIDAHYTINNHCPIQIRARFDRPGYAPDSDVTLRSTEPRMIAAGTYAPLWLVLWFQKDYAVAGKLTDVYRMNERADPPLRDRELHDNGDGTYWLKVMVPDLFLDRALLRLGDRDHWVAACVGGNERTLRIIERT